MITMPRKPRSARGRAAIRSSPHCATEAKIDRWSGHARIIAGKFTSRDAIE
jgi:hypothetical protein